MKRVLLPCLLSALVVQPLLFAASTTTTHRTTHRAHSRVHESAAARHHLANLQHSERVTGAHLSTASLTTVRRHGYVRHTRHHYYERFTASSFANTDLTAGDITAGEDPIVRQAAIDALGDMNGTVVAIDPSNGRILAMVNQKLALSSGAEPCSPLSSPSLSPPSTKASSPKTPPSTSAEAIT